MWLAAEPDAIRYTVWPLTRLVPKEEDSGRGRTSRAEGEDYRAVADCTLTAMALCRCSRSVGMDKALGREHRKGDWTGDTDSPGEAGRAVQERQ